MKYCRKEDDVDDEYKDKEKDKDKDKDKAKTKTKTKCIEDPTCAIFLKTWD